MSRCNFCSFERMKAELKPDQELTIVRAKHLNTYWLDVRRHPKDVPHTEDHFAAAFLALPDHCVCDD